MQLEPQWIAAFISLCGVIIAVYVSRTSSRTLLADSARKDGETHGRTQAQLENTQKEVKELKEFIGAKVNELFAAINATSRRPCEVHDSRLAELERRSLDNIARLNHLEQGSEISVHRADLAQEREQHR
jgi:hypothetical protein